MSEPEEPEEILLMGTRVDWHAKLVDDNPHHELEALDDINAITHHVRTA